MKVQTKREKQKAVFKKRIPQYRKNPVLFSKEILNFEPDEWQIAVLLDLANHPKVTVRSGQGVGKTGLEAVALLWFLSCFPYTRVVATAPTRQQLNDVLWSEISKWLDKSPILKKVLKWTKTRVYVTKYSERWFAVARTATKPENMQGFHEDNMLFIVDEASGVADPIMEAILGTLTGDNNKLLMCGNPTKTSGTFYDSFTVDRENYFCHVINARNVRRTNKDNIVTLDRKYGRDSNVVRVRVDGEFPLQEDDVFIALSVIEQSTMTEVIHEKIARISFGVDVARYGNNETIIAQNISGKVTIPIKFRGQSLMTTVGKIVILYKQLISEYPAYRGSIYVNIDDTGLGGGVTDRLNEVKKEQKLSRMVVVPVNAAGKVPDIEIGRAGNKPMKAADYYDDITTFLWSLVRDAMVEGRLCLENDNELVAQLSCRKYYITSNGKIKLESKDDMKKRSIESPDRADAVALSCYEVKTFSLKNLIS